MQLPYKLYEPFQNIGGTLWVGEYSKLYASCWMDEQTFNIWLFLACLFIVGCVNTAGRRQRRGHAVFWTSSLCLIWAANLFGLHGKSWMHGHFRGYGTLSRFDKAAALYETDLFYGLTGMNVTITVLEPQNLSNIIFIEYIPWLKYSSRYQLQREALNRGAPNPILTIMDYYNAPGELGMGGDLRRATQVSSDVLWFSIAATCYLMVQLAFLPQYVCYGLLLNAVCLIIAYVSFIAKDPRESAALYIEGKLVHIHYGWTFYLVVVTSTLMAMCGLALWIYKQILHRLGVHSPWEADYETPYYWKRPNMVEKEFSPLAAEGKTKLRSHSESSPTKTPRVPVNTPATTLDSWSQMTDSTRMSFRKQSTTTAYSDENEIKKYPLSAPISRGEPLFFSPMEMKPFDATLLQRRLSSLSMEEFGTPRGDEVSRVNLYTPDDATPREMEKTFTLEKKSPDSPFEVIAK